MSPNENEQTSGPKASPPANEDRVTVDPKVPGRDPERAEHRPDSPDDGPEAESAPDSPEAEVASHSE